VTIVRFNRTPVGVGLKAMEEPSSSDVINTLSLFRASLDDAARYGGEVTRQALGVMHFSGKRHYITVDTKVHNLMPGFMPGIPGWHTDGVPRTKAGADPEGNEPPDIIRQEFFEDRKPIYHLLVTGDACPTRFVQTPDFMVGLGPPSHDLYRDLSMSVNAMVKSRELETWETAAGVPYVWDWWTVHTVQKAVKRGWRFLIRVTESDFLPPTTDVRALIRSQNQVYVESTEMGW